MTDDVMTDCYCRYIIHLCRSSSPANIKSVIRAATYEFRFGENYARMLMMLAMIMMYSFNCPLITPFGKHPTTLSSSLSLTNQILRQGCSTSY